MNCSPILMINLVLKRTINKSSLCKIIPNYDNKIAIISCIKYLYNYTKRYVLFLIHKFMNKCKIL